MSSKAVVSSTEGQGRLWERLQLQDMNVRIEHLMKCLTENMQYDPVKVQQVKKEYEEDLKNVIDKIDRCVIDLTKDFENEKQALNQDNSKLKQEIDLLKNEKNRLKTDNINLKTTNQKFQKLVNDLQSNKTNDQDYKKSLQDLKEILEKEKNTLISENITLTTENKNYKLQLQKNDNQIRALELEKQALQAKNEELNKLMSNILGEVEKQFKDQIDNLNKQLNKKISECNEQDLNFKELKTKYDALQARCDDYSRLLKDQLAKLAQKKANVALNKNDDFHQKLQEIKQEYEKDLQTREALWENAKQQSVNALNDVYKSLRDGLAKQNEEMRERIVQYAKNIDELKKEINKLKEQKKELENEITSKDDKINTLSEEQKMNLQRIQDLSSQLFALQREMAQYKIVWNHFFGLDIPLREQILIGKEKLNKFEQQHHVLPPSTKKSKHKIECLAAFGRLPLRLGETPYTDGNQEPRFELTNNFSNKEIMLHKCFLKNEKGDIIQLPDRLIPPSHSIGFSIGNQKLRPDDILVPEDFFQFDNEKSRLMIEDSCGLDHYHVLFPVDLLTINHLENIQNPPLELISMKMDGARGFELKNRSNCSILLQNLFIAREKTNFKQLIPERVLLPGETIRFVFSQNNGNPSNDPDDILIDEKDFGKLDFPDKLLLVDKKNHSIILYNASDLSTNAINAQVSQKMRSVMI